MVEVTFGRCKNQKQPRTLFRIFALKKDVWVRQFEMASPKNFAMFFGYLTKNLTLESFSYSLFSFCAKETACGPKKRCF